MMVGEVLPIEIDTIHNPIPFDVSYYPATVILYRGFNQKTPFTNPRSITSVCPRNPLGGAVRLVFSANFKVFARVKYGTAVFLGHELTKRRAKFSAKTGMKQQKNRPF